MHPGMMSIVPLLIIEVITGGATDTRVENGWCHLMPIINFVIQLYK